MSKEADRILRELVRLKKIKDEQGKTEEYKIGRIRAWQEAFDYINTPEKNCTVNAMNGGYCLCWRCKITDELCNGCQHFK